MKSHRTSMGGLDGSHRPTWSDYRQRPRGISLFVVLVALVMLSLAAVGLIRMVDTGALVAGNLSFKQATTLAADRAMEQAIGWLNANDTGGLLWNDQPAAGYYASAMMPLDLNDSWPADATRSVPDWSASNCAGISVFQHCLVTAASPVSPASSTDVSTRVLITRMCRLAGDPDMAGNSCMRPVATIDTKAGYKGAQSLGGKYGTMAGSSAEYGPYFRIVVQALGPRQTVSLIESTVHFPKGVAP
ncbi:MAG: pilus assembly PilX family protein [Janthinobacterium lividum]